MRARKCDIVTFASFAMPALACRTSLTCRPRHPHVTGTIQPDGAKPMTTYTSDQRHHTAETSETMEQVRYEIDRIDRLLVEILAERQSFMDAAARIKGEREIVHDRARIEDVVTKVLAASAEAGLSPAIAEPVWRTLIDRCIAYEFGSYDARFGPDAPNS